MKQLLKIIKFKICTLRSTIILMSRGNSYLFLCLFMWSSFVQVHGGKNRQKKKGGRGIRARDLEKLKI